MLDNKDQLPELDLLKLQQFLLVSTDWVKICAALQALAWRIQKAKSHSEQMKQITESDFLGCTPASLIKTLDHLLRTASPKVKEHIYTLVNVLAAFKEGRMYLL